MTITSAGLQPFDIDVEAPRNNETTKNICIKGESNPRRVHGKDPGYHYPINAYELDYAGLV
jgi:hypothetical protein